nr:ABC-type transport auxiliary lipoprotein family protein [Aromatoleum evansii]
MLLVLAAGCGTLRPAATPQPAFYSLDDSGIAARAATRSPATSSPRGPTLIVNPPHAVSGYDSQRIIYVREAHKLEYFARSEWVDTPARMVAPLIVAALESGGAFRTVMLTPSAATGDLRLDTEITRLDHDFASQPSRVRFTLRAWLVDNRTRRILASRQFDETVAATNETPYGGVVAANRAVQTVLEHRADSCAEAAANWHPSGAEVPKPIEAPFGR